MAQSASYQDLVNKGRTQLYFSIEVGSLAHYRAFDIDSNSPRVLELSQSKYIILWCSFKVFSATIATDLQKERSESSRLQQKGHQDYQNDAQRNSL
jgi:hypothetical protein